MSTRLRSKTGPKPRHPFQSWPCRLCGRAVVQCWTCERPTCHASGACHRHRHRSPAQRRRFVRTEVAV